MNPIPNPDPNPNQAPHMSLNFEVALERRSLDRCALIGKPVCGRGVCVGGGGPRARSLLRTHILEAVDFPAGLLDLAGGWSAVTIQTQCVRVCEGCGGEEDVETQTPQPSQNPNQAPQMSLKEA